MKTVLCIIFLTSISSAMAATCLENLFITTSPLEQPQILDRFIGNQWQARGLIRGEHGGLIIAALPVNLRLDVQIALEKSYQVPLEVLDPGVANFFGYSFRKMAQLGDDPIYTFPDHRELNGAIDALNDQFKQEGGVGDLLRYHYFVYNTNTPHVQTARELIENFHLRRRWPFADNGRLFYHDSNIHFGLNFMPKKYTDFLHQQLEALTQFAHTLQSQYPALAGKNVNTQIPNENGLVLVNQSVPLLDAFYWRMLTNIDNGSGNFFISLSTNGQLAEGGFYRSPLPSNISLIEFGENLYPHFQLTQSIKDFTSEGRRPDQLMKYLVSTVEGLSIEEKRELQEIYANTIARVFADTPQIELTGSELKGEQLRIHVINHFDQVQNIIEIITGY